tara:strand:- start:1340 stop:2617 length:1278 start_codon:yes stop_codon:yes gene_type:complete
MNRIFKMSLAERISKGYYDQNFSDNDLPAFYGLPKRVKFCDYCVISNQRPNSSIEFKNKVNTKKTTIKIPDDGKCDACKTANKKNKIDWEKREHELIKLLDKHRKSGGEYDCIVPGSGGKDSAMQAHILKYKYGMNPLTITWSPLMYTDYGYQNWKNWIDIGGFDNMLFTRNGDVMRRLTKLSIENLFHPFQTFILGQKNFAPKIAEKLNIPLVFYGENEAEYGNPLADNNTSLRDKSFNTFKNLDNIYLAGLKIKELTDKHNIKKKDLLPFLPSIPNTKTKTDIKIHYLGYYIKWTPQEAYYYAVENTGFKARPFRSQGTYAKYHSIDDKIDDLHFYTTFIKFGIGRATYDASQEIRNKHITREEGIQLVKRYDGEFPNNYFSEIMEYLDFDKNKFMELSDKFKSPHLWIKDGNNWKLRQTVYK